jgi:hypothetical protein
MTVSEDAPPTVEDRQVIAIGHGALLRAVQQSVVENSVTVKVAGVGTVRLPALDSLAWLGGLAVLGAIGVLEWPVAAAIGVGHVLAQQRHLRLLGDFGKALEQV